MIQSTFVALVVPVVEKASSYPVVVLFRTLKVASRLLVADTMYSVLDCGTLKVTLARSVSLETENPADESTA